MLASSEMISENMKATRSVGLFLCKHESGKYCMVHIMRLYQNKLLKKTITQSQYTSSWTIPVIVKAMDTTFSIQVLGSKKKPLETWKKVPRHYPLKLLPVVNYYTLV